jgi:hypothetical protein
MSNLINEDVLGDKIEDAEEEVRYRLTVLRSKGSLTCANCQLFLLYCRRAGFHAPEKDILSSIVVSEYSHNQGSQLGLVDQRHDTIDLQFSFSSAEVGSSTRRNVSRRRKDVLIKTVDVQLAQDITGLRSRVGDTGGVNWN